MIDGEDMLAEPLITDTPAQLKTPIKNNKQQLNQSMVSTTSKNPRVAKEEVHLSQNQLLIEKNERTPLN